MKIGITGANSAVGRALLGRATDKNGGYEFVACVRSDTAAQSLPKLPHITPHIVDYTNADNLADALVGCAVIIHLAGVLIEKKASPYETANVSATRATLKAAERVSAKHFIFISALGADPKSSNRYLRSKGLAEDLLSEGELSSSIIRTPILLGPGTAGTQALLKASAQATTRLLGGGHHRLQPLDVNDLAAAILKLCDQSPPGHSLYELGGPETLTYSALVQRTAELSGHTPAIRGFPIALAKTGASISRAIRGHGMSGDMIDVITADEHISANADKELSITLTPLDQTLMRNSGARATDSTTPQEQREGRRTIGSILFALVALLCFGYLYLRLDSAAAREGLGLMAYMGAVFANVNWAAWLALMAGYSALYFLIDTLVVWRVINWFVAEVTYKDILPIRASAYIISLFNEQVGKGAMAVYLNRRDQVPGWEVGSAMLFIMFCEYFYLLFWATLGYAIARTALPDAFALIPVLATASAIFLVLWVLYFRGIIFPASKLKDGRPLHAFRLAQPKHYLGFLLMRSPAILAAVVVYTAALSLFGVTASYAALLGYLPVIFFAAAIPTPMRAAAITAWIILFPGNEGQMAAFGFVQHNFFILFNAAIGLLFLRRAQRELLSR